MLIKKQLNIATYFFMHINIRKLFHIKNVNKKQYFLIFNMNSHYLYTLINHIFLHIFFSYPKIKYKYYFPYESNLDFSYKLF